VGKYTSAVEESVTLFKRLKAAAQEENNSKIETYNDDLKGLAERQRGLAQGYGLKVCGSGA